MSTYLDHNAGSPLRPEAKGAIARFADDAGGNPSSVHRAGQSARRMLEEARARVAALIGADARQIIFTSGGTEANNLAIFGATRALASRRKVISSSIEHSSILKPLDALENVIRSSPDREGRLSPDEIAASIDTDTALVTLALANSEVGTIQEIGTIAEAAARDGAMFHLDAAQAVGRIPINVAELRCDLMTMSGHKLGAPAGIGALFVADPSMLTPMMRGGPQEGGLRAGTPNLLGAIAFGAAAAAVREHFHDEALRLSMLANELLAELLDAIPGLRLNGPIRDRLPNTMNLTFPKVLGESMLIALDLEGIHVSMGSACAAGAVEPSHVLLAMGLTHDEARSSLRLSLGWNTTRNDIARAANLIPRIWRRVSEAEPSPSPSRSHMENLR
ncbi:MAG TPA: cysteine desulfurase family protein [Candidatus Binataceae bacterium]|nr:cysteine desulfurase family protein [Candidatus Binataceae bacterium]